ncbi:MAG: D-alanine--D-alanine ligase [Treponema sp.]|jgi:D-alanine-D-alanine ligase|nr:D-alanine--D-alanine ligase [Treponema sp.]
MGRKKITVGILFGGKSAEHEISLQSAKNVYDAIDREKYHPVLIGIDKTGRWLLNGGSGFLLNAEDPERIRLNHEGEPVALVPESGGVISNLEGLKDSGAVDVVFPILHGPFGEDGTVQGLLRLADIPFVGSGVLGSAVGMDKDVMKRLLRDGGIPIGKFLVLRSHEALPPFADVTAALGLPLFVKPANMGSSVGVSKIHNEDEYTSGAAEAFLYDTKIILEEYIRGRELECAVLGGEDAMASVPGEVISSHEFYSYDAKYLDEKGAVLEIPAKIPAPVAKTVRELALKTFRALCCTGLSRVDFFLRDTGEVLVNEINTMPGFTKISMYPKLWEASGIGYTELIGRLIDLAIAGFEKEKALRTSYHSGA